jgi:hypothetical protein
MKRTGAFIVAAFVLGLVISRAIADYTYPDPLAGNRPVLAFVCAVSKICPGQVLIDSTGAEKATSVNPAVMDTGATGNLINAVKGNVPLGTTGGWTPLVKTAITNTAQSIKASAGQLGYLQCDNNNNAWSYLQIYDLAVGSVVVGTTVPSQAVPMSPNLSNGFVANLQGMQFATAISIAATTTQTGAGAPGNSLNCTFGYH